MKTNIKSFMLLLLAMLLILTITPVMAEEVTKPSMTFELSEPDSNGFFTASLTIYNATYNGIQVGLGFDKDVVRMVSFEDGSETDKYSEAAKISTLKTDEKSITFNEVGCKISNETGTLKFSAFIMPDGNGAVYATVGENGFKMYEFRFKKLKSADPGFDLLDYKSASYVKELILAGGEDLGVDFEIIVPESFVKDTGKTYNFGMGRSKIPQPEPTDKEKRELRIKDSIILNIGNYAAVIDGSLKWVDSNNKNVYPYIENDRTYVPLRFISESMGAKVNWDAENAKITVSLDGNEIVMTVNKLDFFVNGEKRQMDVTPVIKEDRTFVPIKFVSEALSKSVHWNANSRVVIVTPADRPWNENSDIEKKLLSDSLLIMSPLVRDLINAQ